MQRLLALFLTMSFVACDPADRSSLDEQSVFDNTPKVNRTFAEDSLVVTIPFDRFQKVDIYFGFDSTRAVHGSPPKYKITRIKNLDRLKIVPEMFETSNEIVGAFKCWDSLQDKYEFYPFKLKDINYH